MTDRVQHLLHRKILSISPTVSRRAAEIAKVPSVASVPLAATPFATPPAAHAGEDAKPAPDDPVAALKEHLAAYDAAGGGDTIPIEKGLLGLADTSPQDLLPFASHGRFGPLAISPTT